MKTLHILRKIEDRLALEAIANEQQRRPVTILLLQDAVLVNRVGHRMSENFPDETYACREDLDARGIQSPYRVADYGDIARLIAEHDRVITW